MNSYYDVSQLQKNKEKHTTYYPNSWEKTKTKTIFCLSNSIIILNSMKGKLNGKIKSQHLARIFTTSDDCKQNCNMSNLKKCHQTHENIQRIWVLKDTSSSAIPPKVSSPLLKSLPSIDSSQTQTVLFKEYWLLKISLYLVSCIIVCIVNVLFLSISILLPANSSPDVIFWILILTSRVLAG